MLIKSCIRGEVTPGTWTGLATTGWEAALKEGPGVRVDKQLTLNWCVPVAKTANICLHCIRKHIGSRWGEVILLSVFSTKERRHLARQRDWTWSWEETWTNWSKAKERPLRWLRESLAYKNRLRKLRLFSWKKRRFMNLIRVNAYLIEGNDEEGVKLF